MQCTACGATNETTASTCVVCGATLGSADPAPADPAPAGSAQAGPTANAPAPAGGYAPPPPPATRPHPSGISSESRGWAIGAHLSALGIGLVSAATLSFLGPLVIWLMRKDEDAYVEHHAKEALNFHLTVLLALIASVVLAIPALIIGVLTLGVGLIALAVLVLAAIVLWFVVPILAAIKASNGEGYRYPFTIRFVG
jgi:uncharacterized protein